MKTQIEIKPEMELRLREVLGDRPELIAELAETCTMLETLVPIRDEEPTPTEVRDLLRNLRKAFEGVREAMTALGGPAYTALLVQMADQGLFGGFPSRAERLAWCERENVPVQLREFTLNIPPKPTTNPEREDWEKTVGGMLVNVLKDRKIDAPGLRWLDHFPSDLELWTDALKPLTGKLTRGQRRDNTVRLVCRSLALILDRHRIELTVYQEQETGDGAGVFAKVLRICAEEIGVGLPTSLKHILSDGVEFVRKFGDLNQPPHIRTFRPN